MGAARARWRRDAPDLPVRSADRRQGGVVRRPPARRRSQGRHLAILRGARGSGRRRDTLRHPQPVAPPVQEASVKPAAFDYVRAESLEEALQVLRREGPDARILAGGQTLIPMLNMRLARPRVLVDIMRVPGLDRIESTGGMIRVGAAVRQREL